MDFTIQQLCQIKLALEDQEDFWMRAMDRATTPSCQHHHKHKADETKEIIEMVDKEIKMRDR